MGVYSRAIHLPEEYLCEVTPSYSDKVLRLRGAAVLFWLLPKEDGKRDLRAPPLKNPFKGRVRSAHILPLKIPTVCATLLGNVT